MAFKLLCRILGVGGTSEAQRGGEGFAERPPLPPQPERPLSLFVSSFLFLFISCTEQLVGSYFPNQGSNPCPLPQELGSLNPWTTREVPELFSLVVSSTLPAIVAA